MTARFELQRRPSRLHARVNRRWYVRGYGTVPHPPWGDVGGSSTLPGLVVVTGVTAGSPGTWAPANASPPLNLATLQAKGALGQTGAWTAGQYVILYDGSNAYWNGTAWVAGVVPSPPTGALAGAPGSFTPAGCAIPATLAALQALGALGQTAAWTAGQYVVLGNASNAYWNGTAWTAGIAAVELDAHVSNPGGFSIPEIEAWVDDHAEMADAVLAAEQDRSTPRVTLVDWLQGFISHRDEGTIP